MESALFGFLCGVVANAYDGTRVEVVICVILGFIANQLVQVNRKLSKGK